MKVYGKCSPHRPGERLIHLTEMVSVRRQAASELPWEEIEAAADRVFDDVQRQEIFEIWRDHEVDLLQFEQSVTIARIEELRDELILLSRNLHVAGIGAFSDPPKRQLFHHVLWYLGHEIGSHLRAASDAALKAATALAGPPASHVVVRDKRSQRAWAFQKLIAAMRSNQSDGSMRAEKWGLNGTYDSPRFQGFLTALLGRRIESHEVRNAIKAIEKKTERN